MVQTRLKDFSEVSRHQEGQKGDSDMNCNKKHLMMTYNDWPFMGVSKV